MLRNNCVLYFLELIYYQLYLPRREFWTGSVLWCLEESEMAQQGEYVAVLTYSGTNEQGLPSWGHCYHVTEAIWCPHRWESCQEESCFDCGGVPENWQSRRKSYSSLDWQVTIYGVTWMIQSSAYIHMMRPRQMRVIWSELLYNHIPHIVAAAEELCQNKNVWIN